MDIYKISNEQAIEAIKLIQEYLHKGGTGFDTDKLDAVLEAFLHADQINIEASNDE